MFKTRRRVALGISAATSAVSMIVLAVPAQALTVPIWPTAGHVPTGNGCVVVNAISAPGDGIIQMAVTDTGNPTVSDVWFNAGTTVKAVPAGTPYNINLKVVETCTGVGDIIPVLVHAGTWANISGSPATANVFDGIWSDPQTAKPDDAGLYKIPLVGVSRRYDSLVLRADFTVVGTPVAGTGDQLVVGPWATKSLYILRATTVTNALSAAKVKKGKTVKATAVLKRATNAGYVADNGGKLAVQTKVGSGKWVTNATLTANASGVVTYSFVLTATTQVRFVHPRTLSGNFTEAITSAIKTVTKA
jgi:hypothetical protein